MNWEQFKGAAIALLSVFFWAPAQALPSIQSLVGEFKVGDSLNFTVIDLAPLDGVDPASGLYLADFAVAFDPSVLAYSDAGAPPAIDSFTAPPAHSPQPSGSFAAQVVAFAPPAAGTVFNLEFIAIAASAGTSVTLRSVAGGVYGGLTDTGSGPLFEVISQPLTIALVPEAPPWVLAFAGALLLTAAGRRRRLRSMR